MYQHKAKNRVRRHERRNACLHPRKMYPEALEEFEKCLEMGEKNLHYLTLKGVGSFQAWYYKGCCYEGLGQIKEAAKAYIKSASLSQTYTQPVDALRKLCHEHQEIDEHYLVQYFPAKY